MQGSLIQPNHFKLGAVHPKVILFPNLEHLYQFHQLAEGSKIKSFGPSKKFHFEKDGKQHTAIGGMIGAPLAMLTLEHCLAQPIESIITLGTAGWLGPAALPENLLVCPGFAVDQTGMSREYQIPAVAPAQNAMGLPTVGTLVSGLGFYNLTREKLSRHHKAGFQLLDMEVAMIHCYLRSLLIPHQIMIAITDSFATGSPDTPAWESFADSQEVQRALQKAFDIILS